LAGVKAPSINLVENVGFGDQATHTRAGGEGLANLPAGALHEVCHPPVVEADQAADRFVFNRFYGGDQIRASWRGKFRAFCLMWQQG